MKTDDSIAGHHQERAIRDGLRSYKRHICLIVIFKSHQKDLNFHPSFTKRVHLLLCFGGIAERARLELAHPCGWMV